MSDFAMPAAKPGDKCPKCGGTGEYKWGAYVNGKPTHVGICHSCGGKGEQTAADIARNNTYNRHKLVAL